MDRFVCIHGHFYQPPRENPWLEAVELEESAWPHHDWNERITEECYRPNGQSRILDHEGRIVRIVNNYERISFDVGPTLLAWLQRNAPDVYETILEADRRSAERFGGHGSALAQGYNHAILPLCNDRDRRTQVVWGVRDFEHRFGRSPEGMWLPETAVSTATLEALAEQGLRFTVLAPQQAAAVRELPNGDWAEVRGGCVDPRRPYLARLPSGRTIVLFFYDGGLSRGVAFQGLLHCGHTLARRALDSFEPGRSGPQLVHLATDGETYGHHHPSGDMALAAALRRLDEEPGVSLTNYAWYLERFPPRHEVRIHENTAWSCAHGLGRWSADCGCKAGRPDWSQRWRAPLREALDRVRDRLAALYEQHGAEVLSDPWGARDAYVGVILDRSDAAVESFLETHGRGERRPEDRTRALRLLEMQRYALLMYTSCGWFFDDISGLETVQVLRYAARAVQLAEQAGGRGLEEQLIQMLRCAPGNLPEHPDGADVYLRLARRGRLELRDVAAHYAIRSLFERNGDAGAIYCYSVDCQESHRRTAGPARLHVGRAAVTCRITGDSGLVGFAALHHGGLEVEAATGRFECPEDCRSAVARALAAFEREDPAAPLRLLGSIPKASTHTLSNLVRDEQRAVRGLLLEWSLAQAESIRRTRPCGDGTADGLVATRPDALAIEQALQDLALRLVENPRDADLLRRIAELALLAGELALPLDLRKVQNAVYALLCTARPAMVVAADGGDESARRWVGLVDDLGLRLGLRVDAAA
jgi:alpha-amylase/alpha-mannosidase (GH57 family)